MSEAGTVFAAEIDTSAAWLSGALVELWRHVDALNALPPAGELSGPRALAAAEAVAKVRHAADSLLAPYAARLEELSDPSGASRFARWKGFPSAAALLSATTGLSTSEAGKLIGLGRALSEADSAHQTAQAPVAAVPAGAVAGGADQVLGDTPLIDVAPSALPPAPTGPGGVAPGFVAPGAVPPPATPLADAIRAGWLGTEKATVIRRNLEDMTVNVARAEAFLVEHARGMSITRLRRLCLETFAELDPQGYAERERKQMSRRYLRFYEQADGMVTIAGSLPPILAAPVKAWFEAELQTGLSAQSDNAAQRDNAAHSQRDVGQIMADTLVSMAMHVTGCELATTRPQSTFVIRANKSSLESGEGFATCDGIEAPVTIGRALAWAADIQFAALLQGKNGVPLGLARTRRLASTGQRLVVAERDRGCAKCSVARSRANFHHIITWGDGGPTDEWNLVMLCVTCHSMIHEEGWDVVIENNEVWFIPPASVDPRRRRQPGSSVRFAA